MKEYEELVKALRCEVDCGDCAYWKDNRCDEWGMRCGAADALETAEKRIAELMPKDGEWIEKWRFKTDGTPFHKIGDMECSVCHGDMLGRFYSKYCPHCGALLRGEHDEQIH